MPSAFVVLFHMFIVKFILIYIYIFLSCTLSTIVMKEGILMVVVDDLDFGIINVFEAKVFNMYGTFD